MRVLNDQFSKNQTNAYPDLSLPMISTLARQKSGVLLPIFLCWCFSQHSWAQDHCLDIATPRQVVRDFGHYATAIAKSPTKLAHLNRRDALYLLGFSGATAALIATDRSVSDSITGESGDRRASRYASDILVGAAVGSSTIKYFVGCRERNRQRRDDAVREWEAMGFGLGSVGVLKFFRRERPAPGSKGEFFDSGTSFPSGHSALATAWAAVLGEEYPGHLWRYLALGGAGATSFLRISAREHYPSDVFVGGMIGHLTGEYICRHGKCQETPEKASFGHEDTAGVQETTSFSNPSFEQDSPIYAARRQFCNSISATKEEAERCGQLTKDTDSATLLKSLVVEGDPFRKAAF